MAEGEVLVDYRGAEVEKTRWRTFMVLAHTLSGSAKVAARAAVGRFSHAHADAVVQRWCDHTFRLSRCTVEVRGRENIPRRADGAAGPHVLISHHISLLDIPAVLRAWPGTLRMVAKQELRKVPIWGKAMDVSGIVFIDRKNLAKAIAQLERAKPLLEKGISLWVAAEGTRARDGKLGKFKKGGFHTALQLQVPIVPVWIQGTTDVIEPDQWYSVTGQRVIVSLGEPIPTEGKTTDDLDALMAETRRQMVAMALDCGAPDDVDSEAG